MNCPDKVVALTESTKVPQLALAAKVGVSDIIRIKKGSATVQGCVFIKLLIQFIVCLS